VVFFQETVVAVASAQLVASTGNPHVAGYLMYYLT
jgi:hypothetical protein